MHMVISTESIWPLEGILSYETWKISEYLPNLAFPVFTPFQKHRGSKIHRIHRTKESLWNRKSWVVMVMVMSKSQEINSGHLVATNTGNCTCKATVSMDAPSTSRPGCPLSILSLVPLTLGLSSVYQSHSVWHTISRSYGLDYELN